MFNVPIGRGSRIRTCGLCVPNATLYQAELCLDLTFPIIHLFSLFCNNEFKKFAEKRIVILLSNSLTKKPFPTFSPRIKETCVIPQAPFSLFIPSKLSREHWLPAVFRDPYHLQPQKSLSDLLSMI